MKTFAIMVLLPALIFSAGCEKRFHLTEPISAQELIENNRSQPRSPLSGGFQATSPRGFFQGEIYLEKQEKVQALVYGYLPIGQPLFQLAMDGDSFVYLDFQNAVAYSNRKDWLKDFETESFLRMSRRFISFCALFRQLQAGVQLGRVAHPEISAQK
jgi:hypothetical protein